MDYKEISAGALSTAKTLYASAPVKFIGSALLTMLLHKHALLFYAFVLLVFLDCFTRWMAISYEHLCKVYNDAEDDNYRPTVWGTILGIKEAREEGLISSTVMKHRFLGKIAVYLICVMAAASTDLVMREVNCPTWAVACIIGYLTITELLSIIENLNDAGIEAAQGLYEKIKARRDMIK